VRSSGQPLVGRRRRCCTESRSSETLDGPSRLGRHCTIQSFRSIGCTSKSVGRSVGRTHYHGNVPHLDCRANDRRPQTAAPTDRPHGGAVRPLMNCSATHPTTGRRLMLIIASRSCRSVVRTVGSERVRWRYNAHATRVSPCGVRVMASSPMGASRCVAEPS